MLSHIRWIGLLCFATSIVFSTVYLNNAGVLRFQDSQRQTAKEDKVTLSIEDFLVLVRSKNDAILQSTINRIENNWQPAYEIFLLESLYFSQNSTIYSKLVRLFEQKTNQKFNGDFDTWFQYIWNKEKSYTKEYYEFKAKLHKSIDPKFYTYFSDRADESVIRLDEVRWGGVLQDGIPPLRNPQMLAATDATYLSDSNIVFGINVNGDARAYPKRILAWHEMFVDTVGDTPVAGVYCTLCGTVILYKTEHQGINHELGTSGFLYRSNKLMYDKATQSLWSTLEGEPVIGPLVGKGIQLDYLSVVTTTWGEWKKRHPETTVLSLNTGHRRDYGEGIAYKSYFDTDELMFTIPKIDKSLKNKDEILSIRLPKVTDENIAISSKYLKKHPQYTSEIAGITYTVFTDKTGAHRAFFTEGVTFKKYDGHSTVYDDQGEKWTIEEEKMINTKGKTLERFQTHNAFWFGYKAAFPETKLIR